MTLDYHVHITEFEAHFGAMASMMSVPGELFGDSESQFEDLRAVSCVDGTNIERTTSLVVAVHWT